jgi:hypothetical protein
MSLVDRTPDRHGRPREKWMVEEESEAFQRVRENMMQFERLLLDVLDYDFHVRHPLAYIQV